MLLRLKNEEKLLFKEKLLEKLLKRSVIFAKFPNIFPNKSVKFPKEFKGLEELFKLLKIEENDPILIMFSILCSNVSSMKNEKYGFKPIIIDPKSGDERLND